MTKDRTLETVAQDIAQAIVNGDVERVAMLFSEFDELKSKQNQVYNLSIIQNFTIK